MSEIGDWMGAFGTIIFLAILAYWTWKTRFRLNMYPVIVINIPLLLCSYLGFLFQPWLKEFGGFLYHSGLFFAIYAVTTACLYLWYRLTRNWVKAVIFVFMVPLVFRVFLSSSPSLDKLSVQVIFTVMGMALLVPSAIHCLANRLRNLSFLIISSCSFAAGIFLRNFEFTSSISGLDNIFFWHILVLFSVFFLLSYLFLTEQDKNRVIAEKVSVGACKSSRDREMSDS